MISVGNYAIGDPGISKDFWEDDFCTLHSCGSFWTEVPMTCLKKNSWWWLANDDHYKGGLRLVLYEIGRLVKKSRTWWGMDSSSMLMVGCQEALDSAHMYDWTKAMAFIICYSKEWWFVVYLDVLIWVLYDPIERSGYSTGTNQDISEECLLKWRHFRANL